MRKIKNPDKVIRTKFGCFERVTSPAWGTMLVLVDDFESEEVSADDVSSLKLIDSFPKIPADLWSRWIRFCFEYCSDGVEVSSLLCRKADDLSKWKILIPKQEVSGGSVDADLSKVCDIESGEIFNGFPLGWIHAGSSHSHNTMGAFFSPTDNHSELSVPGLHIVVGKINTTNKTYECEASVVLQKNRKSVRFKDVVEFDLRQTTFHENAKSMVSQRVFFTPSFQSSTPEGYCGSLWKSRKDALDNFFSDWIV